jgi:tetratricopeptide (TPR) repeat protein
MFETAGREASGEQIEEGSVMRTAWLRTIAAALVVAEITGSAALASPAGMALSAGRPAKLPTSSIQKSTAASLQLEPTRPSSQISPTQHPVSYFAAAMSELPIFAKARNSANPVVPPVQQHNDSLALDKPAGPPTPELFISMAQISERQGNVQLARQHYGRALTMWPGHVEVLRAAARMEDRLGELPMAETLYQQAVAANPQHAGALNDLGLCLARQGKLEASIQVIEQAIHLQPAKALYRNNAATVLVEMRQDQRALAHLAAVHEAADANYNLGQLLVQRGRAAEATPYFQAAVAQNPQLQSAHVALAKLQQTIVPDSATSAPTAPAAGPAVTPQPATNPGPQLYYPATARSPELGASTYVPPAYQAPTQANAAGARGGPVDVAPPARYLPPVAAQPGRVQR